MSRKGRKVMKRPWAARPASTVLLFIPLKHGQAMRAMMMKNLSGGTEAGCSFCTVIVAIDSLD